MLRRSFVLLGVLLAACASRASSSVRPRVIVSQVTFAHGGFGPGPIVFTGQDGSVVEERRFESFGVPVDARHGGITDAPDFTDRDLNELDKRTDPSTGWSDHGARWMQPEVARWVSTDPPVEAPDAKFMAAPWKLHPYQYVSQNPISYWDPNGRDGTANPNQNLSPYVAVAIDTNNLVAWGIGLANGTTSDGVTVAAFHADAHVGKWTDSTGSTQNGIQVTADAVKFAVPPGKAIPYIGLDGGFGNAEAGCYASATDFACGAESNFVDGAVTVGTEQNYARFGLSAGVGAMVRLHYGDTNGDGKNEYGAGLDFMFVETDFRTDGEPAKAIATKVLDMNRDAAETVLDIQKSTASAVLNWFRGD